MNNNCKKTCEDRETYSPLMVFLKDLTEVEVQKFMSVSEEIDVGKGKMVIGEGETGNSLYLIEKGSFAVSKQMGENRHEFLSLLETGEFFGEMSLLDEYPRSATVTAAEDSRLRVFRRKKLLKLFGGEPVLAAKIYHNIAATISNRLRRLTGMFKTLSEKSSDIRSSVDMITSDILAVVSHELKTPLAIIKGAAEVLDDVVMPPDKQKKLISHICAHTSHLSRLLDDIVQMEEAQTHPHTLGKEPADIIEMVKSVVLELTPNADCRSVKIKLAFAERLPMIPVSSRKIQKVFYHLIDNGIKFNKEGGLLAISADIVQGKQPPEIVITVKDEGPGIPADKHEELLKCFSQKTLSMDPARTGGLGLGLPLSRSIVVAHGGRLEIVSPTEGGCELTIRLPL